MIKAFFIGVVKLAGELFCLLAFFFVIIMLSICFAKISLAAGSMWPFYLYLITDVFIIGGILAVFDHRSNEKQKSPADC